MRERSALLVAAVRLQLRMSGLSPNDAAGADRLARRRRRDVYLSALLMYVQGWSLAWDDLPVFDDPIEAGPHGPWIGAIAGADLRGPTTRLGARVIAVIGSVSAHYGELHARDLARLARSERPWADAWRTRVVDGWDADGISTDDLRGHFGEKLRSGGPQPQRPRAGE
ncbi:MAG: Panacea domain-containing protein [Actinomycetaceae bacterium]